MNSLIVGTPILYPLREAGGAFNSNGSELVDFGFVMVLLSCCKCKRGLERVRER